MKLAALAILGAATAVFAQTPAPPTTPAPKEITVKSSTSEDALVSIYADLDSKRKQVNDALQQARAELDKENKPLQAQIDPIQKKMQENNQRIGQKFQETSSPLSNAMSKDAAQIEAIQNLVKKEQNLPEEATFDLTTGKWGIPVKPATPPAPAVTKETPKK